MSSAKDLSEDGNYMAMRKWAEPPEGRPATATARAEGGAPSLGNRTSSLKTSCNALRQSPEPTEPPPVPAPEVLRPEPAPRRLRSLSLPSLHRRVIPEGISPKEAPRRHRG